MNKVTSFFVYLLLVLIIFFPIGELVSACFGYSFELISIPAFAAAIAVISVCVIVLGLALKGKIESKIPQMILAIITPLSLINALFYVNECSQSLVVVSVLISTGCCGYLTVKYGNPLSLKTAALVLSALLAYPIGISFLAVLAFGNIG